MIRRHILLALGFCLVIVGAIALKNPAAAQDGSPLHPTFALLDADGENVLDSGNPVSTMRTCGACHDTRFIAEHSFHTDVGLAAFASPGTVDQGRTWDTSPGFFGRWDPLLYRYLSPRTDDRIDLTTPEWIQVFGARHVGGGPAQYARDGSPLAKLALTDGDPETHTVDPATGDLIAWDWDESGIVEMNCFLCHIPNPNNDARIVALNAGDFGWANSDTLRGTGIIDDTREWQPTAFDDDGYLKPDALEIRDPRNENCGQCHGLVHVDAQTPLVENLCEFNQWSTVTTGQIISPQHIADGGLNIAGKQDLDRAWDIHSERVLHCTDCHYSLNNPVYYQEPEDSRPEHLTFDPRRLDLGEYLYRPLHQFAKGQSAQSNLAPEFDNTLRRCESCHTMDGTHDWLPYVERHTNALSCETCHIPKLHAPAVQSVDWTVLQLDGRPQWTCRGIEETDTNNRLLTGYEPVLLPRQNADGTTTLAPHNLVTASFWVYGDPPRPVPLRDLQAVWFDDDAYHPDVLAAFDQNADGVLDESELTITHNAQTTLIAERLVDRGLDSPRIVSETQPYSINHGVTTAEWAIKDCQVCHGDESRITQSFVLADRLPNGASPSFISNPTTLLDGDIANDDGAFQYTIDTDLYVLGHHSVGLVDWFGTLLFLGTVVGISGHSGLRYYAARRRPAPHAKRERVYMYSVYERQWHWIQTLVILGLIFTGLVIHKPDMFGAFSFRYIVQIHNILALILVVNAALAAFYHLVSGEIQQFLPQPRGFFNQAFQQAKFYMQGIFKGEPHPFEKTQQRKMNPLQQITYLAILNILLPLQVITGALIWGAQTWPDTVDHLGGLGFLGPIHTLAAWLFASFIVLHVYLTTTGHTPLAGIQAMVTGWDEVEAHANEEEK